MPSLGMLSRRHRAWAAGLCAVFLGVLGCGLYFGGQIKFCYEVRRITGPPALWASPRPLDGTAVSTAPGTMLSYFGYKFEAPWVGIEKETNEGRWVKVLFSSGQQVFFANPDYWQDDFLLLSAKWEPEAFRQGFGPHPTGSRYEHLKAALSMTPSRLSPFRSHRRFAQDRVYFATKGLWLGDNWAPIEIFAIQRPGYKGFETSGISHDGGIAITLFDIDDREFHLTVSRANTSGARLTQRDINRVLQSFGPTERKLVRDGQSK